MTDAIAPVPEKRPRGHPTKFTPEACDKIITAISLGVPDTVAPNVAGVDYTTFRAWMNDPRPRFRDLQEGVKRAKGERVQRWLGLIEQHATTQWTAAAWKLERMYPEEFGRVDKVNVNGHIVEKKDLSMTIRVLANPKARELIADLEESIATDTQAITDPAEPVDGPGAAGVHHPGGNGKV